MPDLVFVRRRGLSYSFTGEKLTGEQCSLAFERLRDAHPALRAAGIQMTATASLPAGGTAPRYRLVLAWPGEGTPDAAGLDADAVARAFDRILGEINGELAAKQRSGRLGPTQARPMGLRRARRRARPEDARGGRPVAARLGEPVQAAPPLRTLHDVPRMRTPRGVAHPEGSGLDWSHTQRGTQRGRVWT